MESDEQKIREVHSTWIEAVNAGDLVRLLALMADDVVFLNPGRAPFGRDGFAPGFSAAHQQARIVCVSDLEEVVISGDLAYQRGTFTVAATPKSGGATNRISGNFLRIYRRQPDGSWSMTIDMFNSDQPARPPTAPSVQ